MAKNFIKAASQNIEHRRNEYIASIYGTATLGYITYLYTTETEDMIRERCPQVVKGKVLGAFNATHRLFRIMRQEINQNFRNLDGAYWTADFSNAVYEIVRPTVERLQMAVANRLGCYPGIPSINACAMLIVAQAIASEAALYVKRRQQLLRNYTVTTSCGRQSVSFILGCMSVEGVKNNLNHIVDEVISKAVPDNTDLLADPSVETGCKAVLNVLADPDTWCNARDKADRLNKKE